MWVPIQQLRTQCPAGWPSVRSSAKLSEPISSENLIEENGIAAPRVGRAMQARKHAQRHAPGRLDVQRAAPVSGVTGAAERSGRRPDTTVVQAAAPVSRGWGSRMGRLHNAADAASAMSAYHIHR